MGPMEIFRYGAFPKRISGAAAAFFWESMVRRKNKQFYQHLNTVQNLPINLKAQRNAYEHVWGYFKKVATPEERQHFFTLLDQMTETDDQALLYLKKLAEKYQIDYLLASHFFD